MKTLKIIILSLFAAFLITGCSSSSSPEATTKKFYSSLLKGDFVKASEYTNYPGSISLFSQTISKETLTAMKKTNPKIEIKSVDYNEEKTDATVDLTISDYYDFENDKFYSEPGNFSVDLELIDGKWYVDCSK